MTIPTNIADLMKFRRETNGQFDTTLRGDPTTDYAVALQKIATGLSHASEAIPNGQRIRALESARLLLEGSIELSEWVKHRVHASEVGDRGNKG